MSYDPLFDVAHSVVDEVMGTGEYARLNASNPGVPAELRKKLRRWTEFIDPATIPDAVIVSENAKRNARKRKTYTGGAVWAKHNSQVNNCRCKRCIARRAKEQS